MAAAPLCLVRLASNALAAVIAEPPAVGERLRQVRRTRLMQS